MRRQLTILLSTLFLLAGCGGESGEADETQSTTAASVETTAAGDSTTTTASPATTARQASNGGDDFCDSILREPEEELDITDPESIEAALTEAFEHLQNLPVDVPNEIADEWAEYLELTELSLELYDEYDYNLLAIPEEEITEIQGQLAPSQTAILDYCGLDDFIADEPEDDSDDPAAGSGSAVLPEEAYTPPGVFDSSTEGILTLMRSEASFDDVVAYYEDLLDATGDAQGDGYVGFSESSGVRPDYLIGIEQRDDHVLITISVPES